MSKPQHPHSQALAVAERLRDALTPFCVQIEIAGSLRRRKPTVGDIELLYVPQTQIVKGLKLFQVEENQTDVALDGLIRAGVLAKRPNIKGQFSWGDKNKLALHVSSGIPVDFFATTIDHWHLSRVVRTGSKEMNLELTTSAKRLGRHLQVSGGIKMEDGSVVNPLTEQRVFELCGVKYRPPEER